MPKCNSVWPALQLGTEQNIEFLAVSNPTKTLFVRLTHCNTFSFLPLKTLRWFLPESSKGNGKYGPWPCSGEIDLLETVNDDAHGAFNLVQALGEFAKLD